MGELDHNTLTLCNFKLARMKEQSVGLSVLIVGFRRTKNTFKASTTPWNCSSYSYSTGRH
jgi:hypothetical protein